MCAKIGDKRKNFDKISELLSLIDDVDVIVLPEVWNTGWSCADFINNAEDIKNSETLEFLSDIAVKKNSNIIGGSFIQKAVGDIYYNSCPVLDRKGVLRAIYNKNHLYSYYGCNEGTYISKGLKPVMVDLEGVNFGLSVCYDIRFPEIYRAYRKAGTDILINCAAWASTKPVQWDIMTKSRAVENQTYMIAVNQYGPMKNNETNLGHSRIIDYNGNVISQVLSGEAAFTAVLNLEEMYRFRDKCTILNDIKETYEVEII